MNYDSLLIHVEKPGRYLGSEVNAVRKDWTENSVRIALAFPDVYEVAMSHLGLQILYTVLNSRPDVLAERFHAPWPDMEGQLRAAGVCLTSLETRKPMSAFDLVGFSLQYELSFTNVLAMLDLGRIPLRAAARTEQDPLVIAGGPCAFQPAPMAPFFDAFVIGEGEEAILEIVEVIGNAKKMGWRRQEILERLSALPGIYVPAIHPGPEKIRKRVLANLDDWSFAANPIIPLIRTIHDRIVIEVARGCTRGCRFCQAGMVWRPVRERHPEVLLKMADTMLSCTGHDEISLLSLSSGDYSRIEPLIASLMERHHARNVALAMPSLRPETLTKRLMEEIRRVRKTSFTLAPEAGTQRMRNIINKGNTESDLLATTREVFEAGWKAVKLYFMIGLPFETEEDIEGIVELSHRVLREGRYRGQVTANLSTFVPRPHTPFQWNRQISMEETLNKQVFIKKRLNHRQISVKWHDKRMSLLEGLLSRGDESAADLIEQAFMYGCRFDGWSEHFRFDHWERAMETCGIDFHRFLEQRSLDALLPWDRIETGVRKDYLIGEAQKAQEGLPTEDCRSGPCGNCGVCDGKSIRIVKANECAWEIKEPGGEENSSDDHFKRILFSFSKIGPSRFLSHLEISTALIRALVMAGIPPQYSRGFHPLPKISFPFATPVGLESAAEYFEIRTASNTVLQAGIIQAINDRLPEGLRILYLEEVQTSTPSLSQLIHAFDYEILLDRNLAEDEIARISQLISNFMNALSFLSAREKDGKTIEKDIRPFVLNLELNKDKSKILLTARFGPAGTVRPMEILTSILGLAPDKALALPIRKVKTHFSGPDNKCIDK